MSKLFEYSNNNKPKSSTIYNETPLIFLYHCFYTYIMQIKSNNFKVNLIEKGTSKNHTTVKWRKYFVSVKVI